MKEMKKNKAVGDDGVTLEMLQQKKGTQCEYRKKTEYIEEDSSAKNTDKKRDRGQV